MVCSSKSLKVWKLGDSKALLIQAILQQLPPDKFMQEDHAKGSLIYVTQRKQSA